MRVDDFGPVPVSQVKTESKKIFAALEAGRRVLLSRHGQVVAAVEPASVDRHAKELALFAVAAPGRLRELSATTIGQGSPSDYVRDAESGVSSYVTRDHRVYGVLTGIGAAPDQTDAAADLASISEQERALADFERNHPDATAEEFAAAVAAASPPDRPVGVTNPSDLLDPLGEEVSDDDLETVVEALFVKAQALQSSGATKAERRTFIDLVGRYASGSRARVRTRVTKSMVALGRSYADSDPERAVELVDTAIDWISVGDIAVVAVRDNEATTR